MDSELEDRYFLDYIIGCGTYSKVYSGHDKTNKNEIAVKFEMLTSFDDADNSYLKREYDVYSKLTGKDSIGVADIKMFGCDEGKVGEKGPRNYLVMELLGLDLEKLLQQCSGKFSLKTVLLLADQMISIIQYIHSIGYIHGDVKPANFLLGRKEKDNMLYMVDFWLAKEYIDPLTKNHISYNETARCQGITRFTSINCHKGIGQSRRDDLESLGYVFLYLLRGNLPWPGITVTENIDEKEQEKRLVYEKKVSISLKELCFGQSSEFETYLEYCRSLQFDEEPDYAYLKKIFKELFHRSGFTEDNEYDWKITQPNNGVLSKETNMESHTDEPFLRSTSPEGADDEGDAKGKKRSREIEPEGIVLQSSGRISKRPKKDYDPYSPPRKPDKRKRLFTSESSDEDFTSGGHRLRPKQLINYCNNFAQKYFLPKKMNSSSVLPETLFYFMDIHYEELKETLPDDSLETVEDCLENALKFVSDQHSEGNFKWNNLSIAELSAQSIRNSKDMQWINNIDSLDYKTASPKDLEAINIFIARSSRKLRNNGLFFMQSAFMVYTHDIVPQTEETDINDKSEAVKRFIDSVATLTSPLSLLRNGAAKEVVRFYVRDYKLNLEEYIESKKVKITVKPDGVFTTSTTTDAAIRVHDPSWQLVIEIYGPSSDEFLSAQRNTKPTTPLPIPSTSNLRASTSPDPSTMLTSNDDTKEAIMDYKPYHPTSRDSDSSGKRIPRRDNFIIRPDYRKYLINYEIEPSLPIYCRGHAHTRQKIAGQHVLQLIAQFQRKKFEGDTKDGKTIEKSIGMFFINEFVYFSRLDIPRMMRNFYAGEEVSMFARGFLKKNPPKVRYSHFRFDITKKNHRMALVIFVQQCLNPEKKELENIEYCKKFIEEIKKDLQ